MAKRKSKPTLRLRKPKKSAHKPLPIESPKGAKKQSSVPKKPKSTTRPRTLKQYFAMAKASQEKWDRVGQVISKMQSSEISLQKASREIGVSQKTVVKLAGSALRKRANGKYAVNKSEKILRVLVMPTSEGLKEIAVRGFEAASKIGKYDAAVQKYLRTGDDSKLKRFRRLKLKDASGKRIQFLTDTAELKRQGLLGQFSFESLYARVA